MDSTVWKGGQRRDGHRILDDGWLKPGEDEEGRADVARGSSFTFVVFVLFWLYWKLIHIQQRSRFNYKIKVLTNIYSHVNTTMIMIQNNFITPKFPSCLVSFYLTPKRLAALNQWAGFCHYSLAFSRIFTTRRRHSMYLLFLGVSYLA